MFRALSSELQKKARKELNEIPEQVDQDIKYIHKWIFQQPHLHNITASDQWILNFLRGCKFSLEKTKQKLDMYYTMKTLLPELYKDRDPFLPEIQKVLDLGSYLPLRNTIEKAGPKIIIIRILPEKPSIEVFSNVIKTFLMITDILLNEDDNFVIAGQEVLADFKFMNIHHAMHADVAASKKAAICLQHAYPSRPKGFHCINIPSIFEILINIIKPVLSEKVRKRINVYSTNNMEKISKIIPKSVLPTEYGGNGESLEDLTVFWKKKVESYRDWFLEDSKYCSDETKRFEKQSTVSDMFGIEGSFRRLNVD